MRRVILAAFANGRARLVPIDSLIVSVAKPNPSPEAHVFLKDALIIGIRSLRIKEISKVYLVVQADSADTVRLLLADCAGVPGSAFHGHGLLYRGRGGASGPSVGMFVSYRLAFRHITQGDVEPKLRGAGPRRGLIRRSSLRLGTACVADIFS